MLLALHSNKLVNNAYFLPTDSKKEPYLISFGDPLMPLIYLSEKNFSHTDKALNRTLY